MIDVAVNETAGNSIIEMLVKSLQ